MAHIFREGNNSVHIGAGEPDPIAYCYDLRDDEFLTLVKIDLLAFLPLLPMAYGEDEQESRLPSWPFVADAMRVCAEHEEQLWAAWENLRDDLRL